MRELLYRWNPTHSIPPRWMAVAYYSLPRNRVLYVIAPFNLLIAVLWWLQDRWARAANAPSWIDREVEKRAEHFRSTRLPFS